VAAVGLSILGGVAGIYWKYLDARAETESGRRSLYAAKMQLAQRAWRDNQAGALSELLEEMEPREGQTDLRGFEWYYLSRLSRGQLLNLRDFGGQVRCVAFSPDGTRIASASYGLHEGIAERHHSLVQIRDANTGQVIQTLNTKIIGQPTFRTDFIDHMVFSPDGKRLALLTFLHEAIIWNLQTGAVTKVSRDPGYINSDVLFSPDGRRLACVEGNYRLVEFDADTGDPVVTLEVVHKEVDISNSAFTSFCYRPDGKQLVGIRNNGTTVLWNIADDPRGLLQILEARAEDTGRVLRWDSGLSSDKNAIAFSGDGERLIVYGGQLRVKIWDTRAKKEALSLTLEGNADISTRVAISPDGRVLAGGYERDRSLRVWDLEKGKELYRFLGHKSRITDLTFSPDSRRLLSSSHDRTVKIFHLRKDLEARHFRAAGGEVTCLAFSPNGSFLACGTDAQTILVWDVVTDTKEFVLEGHKGRVTAVTFSPDGQLLASCSADTAVKVWDVAGRREVVSFADYPFKVMTLAFSADGRRLSGAFEDDAVVAWDLGTRNQVAAYCKKGDGSHPADEPSRRVTLSPDGNWLYDTIHGVAHSWKDRSALIYTNVPETDDQTVQCVCFTPDSRFVAHGRGDGTICLRDPGGVNDRLVFKGHTNAVNDLAFTGDGQRLASAANDGSVRIWHVQTGQELLRLEGHAGQFKRLAFSRDGRRLAGISSDGEVVVWDATQLSGGKTDVP
jgi:WD40 repeat protein